MSERDWIFEALRDTGVKNVLYIVSKYIFGKIRGIEDLVKCSLCPNMCKYMCPTHIASGSETHSPAGRARIAYYIEKNLLEISPQNIYSLYTCLGCGACSIICPFNFRVDDLIYSIKVGLKDKLKMIKGVNRIIENLSKYSYLYGPKPKDNYEGKILYLRGCTIREHLPELAKLTIDVFNRLGVELATLSEESCCGIHAYHMGMDKLFKKLARENSLLIENFGGEYCLTSCPAIAYTYRILYPRINIKMKIKVLHITEVLKELLVKEKLHEVKKTVVIHDSGMLTRGLGLESLYSLLKIIPGLRIKLPMRTGREVLDVPEYHTLLPFIDEKMTRKIVQERIRELKEEADTIVVSSPDLKILFSDFDVDVYDVIEIIGEALGV